MVMALADFFAGLAMVEATFSLDSNVSISETGAGDLNRAAYGVRLWRGSVTLAPEAHADADALMAKIQYLEEADQVFRVCLPHKAGETAGTISAIGTDRREITLNAAQAVGSVLGISYASGARRSAHRVVTVDGLVHTVVPAVPLTVTTSDTTTYGRAEIDAVMEQASLGAYRAVIAQGLSFDWRQAR